MQKRLIGLTLILLSAFSLSTVAEAQVKMPDVNKGFTFSLSPGECVTIQVRFEAYFENLVSIWDQDTGKRIQAFNNNAPSGGPGDVVLPRNTTNTLKTYLIFFEHKEGHWDEGKPWKVSPFKVFENSEKRGVMKIGAEDGSGGKDPDDFNDATATIIFKCKKTV